jgi:hypothetical protein
MALRPSRDLTAVKADPVCRKEGTSSARSRYSTTVIIVFFVFSYVGLATSGGLYRLAIEPYFLGTDSGIEPPRYRSNANAVSIYSPNKVKSMLASSYSSLPVLGIIQN